MAGGLENENGNPYFVSQRLSGRRERTLAPLSAGSSDTSRRQELLVLREDDVIGVIDRAAADPLPKVA